MTTLQLPQLLIQCHKMCISASLKPKETKSKNYTTSLNAIFRCDIGDLLFRKKEIFIVVWNMHTNIYVYICIYIYNINANSNIKILLPFSVRQGSINK